jgi:hypothetical protein
MVAAGAAATVHTTRRGDPPAVPVAFGYFTVMEALQGVGYQVVDVCGSPTNQVVTYLSMLHIVFQPLVINAFAMVLVAPVGRAMQTAVYTLCALASAVMLLQLYPFAWAGSCLPGANLCADRLCTVSGEWHIAWDIPYNGLLAGIDAATGWAVGFPTYVLAVFGLPLLYGAWRFVVFHALAGPLLASALTGNPNETPAIWCLFSIGLLAIAYSPWFRNRIAAPGGRWQAA